jgi:hypothetical protein
MYPVAIDASKWLRISLKTQWGTFLFEKFPIHLSETVAAGERQATVIMAGIAEELAGNWRTGYRLWSDFRNSRIIILP